MSPSHGMGQAWRDPGALPLEKHPGDQQLTARGSHSLLRGIDGQKNKALKKSEPYLYNFYNT